MAKKIIEGVVISLKIPLTAVVEVEKIKIDKRYKKRYKTNKKYMAHYENIELSLGDRVLVSDSKPYSKNKKWSVQGIVEKSK